MQKSTSPPPNKEIRRLVRECLEVPEYRELLALLSSTLLPPRRVYDPRDSRDASVILAEIAYEEGCHIGRKSVITLLGNLEPDR